MFHNKSIVKKCYAFGHWFSSVDEQRPHAAKPNAVVCELSHPSRFYPLLCPSHGSNSLSRDGHTFLSTATSSSSSEVFQGQPWDVISPASALSAQQDMPQTPNLCQKPEPPHLVSFDVEGQQLYSEHLLNDWGPHPLSNAEIRHPSEDAHLPLLVSTVSVFRSFLTACGRGCEWKQKST